MRPFIFLLLLFCFQLTAQEQLKFRVRDAESKQTLLGARIKLDNKEVKANQGVFQIDLWEFPDSVLFECKSKGYQTRKEKLLFTQNDTIFFLTPLVQEIQEVVISSNQKAGNSANELGTLTLTKKQIEKLPTFLGESDPIKAMQLLPGIQSSGDGNGIYVRGGGIDQNLILLDDVPLYNISHLFGFFSVFNNGAIQKMDVYKGGMPANYGGRISSVVAITGQTGNLRKWKVDGGIGILASNLTIHGPIKKDTSSMILSLRRTYVDVFQRLLASKDDHFASNYYFYDVNFKYFHRFNAKNKLTISTFLGKDDFLYNDQWDNAFANKIDWGSKLFSSKWTHIFSERTTMNVVVGLTNYQLNFAAQIYSYHLALLSQNRDYLGKIELTTKLTSRHTLKYGIENTYRKIAPNNFAVQGQQEDSKLSKNVQLFSNELALYVNDDFVYNEKWSVSLGLRYSIFQQLGPFDRFSFGDNIADNTEVHYGNGKQVIMFGNPEPRLAIDYKLNPLNSIKLGLTQNYQYIHLAPVSSISLPTDVWVPSSSIIKPQEGKQISLGYFKTFENEGIEFSVETYYKQMNNLIEYKEGVMSLVSLKSNYDDNFFFGKGESYGVEWLARKNVGKWNGWLGYTLSKSTRSFPDIETGRVYFAKNDRRHDISFVVNYELSSKWTLSGVFVFKSGNAITIPLSRYILQGNIINTYSPKNAYRIPPYHRADVSLNYVYKKTEKREESLNFSIYNIYGRQNPFYIYYETKGDLSKFSIETKAKQVSLFTILPSISWKIAF